MTTPASGVISLNDIGTELGYTSGSNISLRDDNVRYLSGSTSNSSLQLDMSSLYGKTTNFTHVVSSAYWATVNTYGKTGSSYGSIIPTITKSNTFGSTPIASLYWQGGPSNFVALSFNAVFPNAGFTSINISGTTFLRTSATVFSNTAAETYWTWTTSTNPFGIVDGVYAPVTFVY
jgi:hypothetical protein